MSLTLVQAESRQYPTLQNTKKLWKLDFWQMYIFYSKHLVNIAVNEYVIQVDYVYKKVHKSIEILQLTKVYGLAYSFGSLSILILVLNINLNTAV